ncbi:hypothetical protein DUI87_24577 [Hirundo rustica rustica]|uniref:Uncharacterized protein n=1 Tax=Hirundo rustica rustica TaxID=333673 RepID=A0A3M0JDJ3_HIRRU|nr:hypothetical protein DUI87_24577 [Hirundo rustica rustica]
MGAHSLELEWDNSTPKCKCTKTDPSVRPRDPWSILGPFWFHLGCSPGQALVLPKGVKIWEEDHLKRIQDGGVVLAVVAEGCSGYSILGICFFRERTLWMAPSAESSEIWILGKVRKWSQSPEAGPAASPGQGKAVSPFLCVPAAVIEVLLLLFAASGAKMNVGMLEKKPKEGNF